MQVLRCIILFDWLISVIEEYELMRHLILSEQPSSRTENDRLDESSTETS